VKIVTIRKTANAANVVIAAAVEGVAVVTVAETVVIAAA